MEHFEFTELQHDMTLEEIQEVINMGYKTYFIKLWDSGEGVTIHTDTRCTIRLEDIYINPYTDLGIILYLDPTGKSTYSRCACNDFNQIEIQQVINDMEN